MSSAGSPPVSQLPDSHSQTLHLSHPTASERRSILRSNAAEWRYTLTVEDYVEISMVLADNPEANFAGFTEWILVEGSHNPNQRHILASCETYVKRAWVNDPEGGFKEVIVHGIASVFCDPQYRGRGYAKRMLRELGLVLRTWKTDDHTECVGSVLWSDIGKTYYNTLGWSPGTNVHLEFPSLRSPAGENVRSRLLRANDLPALCAADSNMIRKTLLRTTEKGGLCMTIIPDHSHMLWHHIREELIWNQVHLHSTPGDKGVIAGQPENRVWAIWAHGLSSTETSSTSQGTLYILRLVVERPEVFESRERDLSPSEREELVLNMKIVLQSAQAEAAKWKLGSVRLWNPSDFLKELISKAGIEYSEVDREKECIGSLQWYGPDDEENVEWIGNERYAWC
jgi:GNAT superfamily N-acetyltransferase